MTELRQGSIRWAELPGPAGRRPVLVLTRTRAIARLSNVTVAPLTRTRRGIESEVDLLPTDGVPKKCVISLDNILTIPKSLLSGRIADLNSAKMKSVFSAIRFVFEMP